MSLKLRKSNLQVCLILTIIEILEQLNRAIEINPSLPLQHDRRKTERYSNVTQSIGEILAEINL